MTGQYVDGHKHSNVVQYRQGIFLPNMACLEPHLCNYNVDGEEEPKTHPGASGRQVVIWYHNESTFYANDRCMVQWNHSSHSPKPIPKGEGASIMVADFISADYGWLCSPDGSESARVLFKAGKNRDGYFTNTDVLDQATTAMDILEQYYPNEDHVFVFDNATTHTKRTDTALSATKMPLNPTASRHQMWGVDVNVIGQDGKPVYGPDGKIQKQRVQMGNASFDGKLQSLYFTPDDGLDRQYIFKGMARILQECGIDTTGLKRESTNFKCADLNAHCCIQQVLWNQPNFVNIKLLLEMHCEARGFQVIFLPKFHCKLNFLKQYWGAAKRRYRLLPRSKTDHKAALLRNVIEVLDSVDLVSMRR
jgi:hypothetical protein